VPFQYAGATRIPPASMQLRVRREIDPHDTTNARQFESWMTDLPIPQGGELRDKKAVERERLAAYDMQPLASRTDKRDYRQAQPFVADGPGLALNPFFDRYDPTRDPRNMIREVRAAVYEEKEPDRGLAESRRLQERELTNRWVAPGFAAEEVRRSLDAFEIIRPKIDDLGTNYRGQKPSDGAAGSEPASYPRPRF
jgi:hypothetical protein